MPIEQRIAIKEKFVQFVQLHKHLYEYQKLNFFLVKLVNNSSDIRSCFFFH